MRAIVLGAGASYGASDDHGIRCPMVDGVFRTAALLGLFDGTYATIGGQV
jgi:hypothetical protein